MLQGGGRPGSVGELCGRADGDLCRRADGLPGHRHRPRQAHPAAAAVHHHGVAATAVWLVVGPSVGFCNRLCYQTPSLVRNPPACVVSLAGISSAHFQHITLSIWAPGLSTLHRR